MMFSRVVGVNGFIAQWVAEWQGLDYIPELLAHTDYANIVVLIHMLWLGFPGDLIVWGGTFARIPAEVLESGQLDGANWWTEFTQIIVPMVWPTVALQLVLMFCGIFGASGAVFLLTGGGAGTMTLQAWMYIELLDNSGGNYASGVYNYMSAVGLMLTIVAVCISLSIRRITDKMFDEVEF
jgi:ABC-type sugar transport system permease subunit